MNKWLLVCFMAFCAATATPQSPGLGSAQSTMTVDAVIKLVQVKLADDLIISLIRKSGKPSPLSADEMIRLKTAGVSDSVIRVMLDPQAAPAPPLTDISSSVSEAKSSQALQLLPSSFGYYVLDNQKLTELRQTQVDTKFGLTVADRGFAVDGIPENAPLPRVESLSPTIIVYQQNVSTSALQLSELSLVRTMKAYQFNIINTAPQFFANVYQKNPNETIVVNLWRPSRAIQMRVEPVEGKAGMYKLLPTMPLGVGKYALYFPDSIHASDVVFSASNGRQAVVLSFEIVRGEGSAPDISRTGGILHLARPDGQVTPVSIEKATLRWAFGARKTADVNGARSNTRFGHNDKISFIVSTPPMGWADPAEYKIYVFEVKNGKRTSVINKTGFGALQNRPSSVRQN
jgi:hypothetical protein